MNRSLTNCGSLRRIAGWMFSTVAILIVGSSLVALGADGVPNAVKKLDKTHKQLSTIRLRAIEPGATLQDFCVDRDGLIVALLAKVAPVGTVVSQAGAGEPIF